MAVARSEWRSKKRPGVIGTGKSSTDLGSCGRFLARNNATVGSHLELLIAIAHALRRPLKIGDGARIGRIVASSRAVVTDIVYKPPRPVEATSARLLKQPVPGC